MRRLRRPARALLIAALTALGLSVSMLAASSPAAARRVALVVGNNLYSKLAPEQQLTNAVNDAKAVRDTLAGLGFQVIFGETLERRTLIERLFDMAALLGKDDVAFFFFAGHGVSFNGANYLLPSDIPAPRASGRAEEGRLADLAVAETQVMERITQSGARVTIIVLDACRNNPLQDSGRRSVGSSRGLVQSQPAKGVFSIYSAGFGQEALDRLDDDDHDPNSVFTRVFIKQLKTPGLDLRDVATRTRRSVVEMAQKVGHEQYPAYYDQLVAGDIYLAGRGNAPAPSAETAPQPVVQQEPGARAWAAIQGTTSTAVLEAFIRRFERGIYVDFARARLDEIKRSQVAARETPALPPPPAVPVRPSFDCGRASLPAERAICDSSRLAALDVRMTALYTGLRSRIGPAQRASLLASQRNWLHQRNACGSDASCIERRYLEQIRYLQGAG
jgi:uncharacterized caspase-like protein/uncharacterized protein YecT (DUF1311 family)